MNGNANYIIDAAVYHLQPNDLLFIPVGSYHYLIPDPESAYERICIHFPKDLIPNTVENAILKFKPIYHIQKKSIIDNIFSALLHCEYVEQYHYNDMIYLIEQSVSSILSHLKYRQNDSPLQPVTENTELHEMLDFINENITEPLTLDFLMKRFFKSSSWISHTFKTYLGIPPKKYINNKKILYSQELISSGTPPMQAAEIVGFDNYPTFYRAYLRFLGRKPHQDFITP